MSNDNIKVEESSNVISATSTGEVKKLLEGRWLKTSSFTNISDFEFEGMWDGNPYIIASGATETFPIPLAEHLAAHLAGQIISREGKIPSDNVEQYNQLVGRILGKETIDFSSYSYADLQAIAKEKGLSLSKENGKLFTKSELISTLAK